MHAVAQSHFRHYLVVTACISVFVLALAVTGSDEKLSPEDFKIAVQSMESAIQSADLLVQQAGNEAVWSAYLTNQLAILNDEVAEAVRPIHLAHADRSQEAALREAGSIAEDAVETMRKLAQPGESDRTALAQELSALASRARELLQHS